MCHTSRSEPMAIPLAAMSVGDGFVELKYTLALAKVTTLRDGMHRSTSGTGSFPYPLDRGWVHDADFEPRSHIKCLHFGTPKDAIRGHLNDYGSHRLITLPSKYLHGKGTAHQGRCWHDGATLPVCCLACDAGDDLSVLNTTEFWDEVRARRGGDLGVGLYRDRAVLPEAMVPGGFAPLDLEWLREKQRRPDSAGDPEKALARWSIGGWDVKVTVLLRRVAKGWWLENTYPIELHAGQQSAQAILCEDEEHGLYFHVADHAFGRLLTGEDRPVSVATPVAAQVVEYLEHVPGRWALPSRPQFPLIHRRRFGDDAAARHAPAIRRPEEELAPACTVYTRRRANRVSAP